MFACVLSQLLCQAAEMCDADQHRYMSHAAISNSTQSA
jgi:hypothetical protein